MLANALATNSAGMAATRHVVHGAEGFDAKRTGPGAECSPWSLLRDGKDILRFKVIAASFSR